MRTTRAVLLAGLLGATFAGCGGGHSDPVEGIWALGEDTSVGCIQEWEFNNGAGREQVFCPLVSGPVGFEVNEGVYTRSDSTIFFELRRSSCGGSRETVNLGWRQNNRNELTLAFPSGLNVTLTRRKGRVSVTGVSASGCFDGDNFIQHPVQDL